MTNGHREAIRDVTDRRVGKNVGSQTGIAPVVPGTPWSVVDPTRTVSRGRRYAVACVVRLATHETPTRHGFDVLRGVIEGNTAPPSIILTQALADHLERHRSAPRDVDLPISGIAITRLRRDLGHDWHADIEAWCSRVGFSMRKMPRNSGSRDHYAARDDGSGGTIVMVCFASGTRIRTTHGEVAVEHLSVGDFVATGSGGHRPIRWLGYRAVDCRRDPMAQPARIAAHALGQTVPTATWRCRLATRSLSAEMPATKAATLSPS